MDKMKHFTFRKRLLALAVCAFAWIGANAQSYTVVENPAGTVTITKLASDGTTVDKTTGAVSLPNPWPQAESTSISGATTLILKGYFSNEDFNQLKGTNHGAQTLNLTDAMLDQSQLNDLSGDSNIGNTTNGGQTLPNDSWKNSVTSISLPTDQNFKNLGEDFCKQFQALTTVTIPSNIEVISDNAFSECSSLASVTFSAPSHLKVIGYHAFYQTILTEVTIPATVEYVGKDSFGTIPGVSKVVFADVRPNETAATTVIVKNQAFNNSKSITDVYIENTKTPITCENGAFDFDTTWAHGDPTQATATLHFPEDFSDNYANKQHPLNMATALNPADFHDWLMEHYNLATTTYTNGWYEFKNNGTIDGDPNEPTQGYGEKFLRTYCDMKNDRLVPEGVKAYIVSNVDKDTYEATLEQLFVIPKGTGVILYGEPNSRNKDGHKTLSMSVVAITDSKPLCRNDDGTFTGVPKKNYLVPTGTDGVEVFPYEPFTGNNPVEYRSFGMGRIQSTTTGPGSHTSNFVGFFRLIHGNMGGGKAYLRLSAAEYPNAKGAEVIIVPDTKPVTGLASIAHYQVEYKKDASGAPIGPNDSGYWFVDDNDEHIVVDNYNRPNMKWDFETNWGNRSQTTHAKMGILSFDGEPEIVTDGISSGTVMTALQEGAYYSIQGVKTVSPAKGVFIKNGKKVVIK